MRPCDCPNAAETAAGTATAAASAGPDGDDHHNTPNDGRGGAGAGAGLRPRRRLRGRAATAPIPPVRQRQGAEYQRRCDVYPDLSGDLPASQRLSRPDVALQDAQPWIVTQRRHALAAKLSGTSPRTHTRWIASYRWINGSAITR